MRLFDRIAECRTPVLIQRTTDGGVTRVSGAADYAEELTNCPVRYVLTDDLVRVWGLDYARLELSRLFADRVFADRPFRTDIGALRRGG